MYNCTFLSMYNYLQVYKLFKNVNLHTQKAQTEWLSEHYQYIQVYFVMMDG